MIDSIASRTCASLPGRTKTCSSATFAVSAQATLGDVTVTYKDSQNLPATATFTIIANPTITSVVPNETPRAPTKCSVTSVIPREVTTRRRFSR